MHKAFGLFFAFFVTLSLGACSTVEPQTFPKLSFSHLPKMGLDAASLQIKSSYKAPMKAPNVDHLMPVTLEDAMTTWANDRLAPAGTDNILRFTIAEASVTEDKLATDKGLTGAFKDEQAQRYKAVASALVEIIDSKGLVRAHASAVAHRTTTVAESISMEERNKVWFRMVSDLMVDFNAALEQQVKIYLGGRY